MVTAEEVRLKIPERFWSKIRFGEPNDCWEWQGFRNDKNYGIVSIKINGKWKNKGAHRFLFTQLKGDLPKYILVCHSCDNPPCCNPNHFFPGTMKDNMDDKIRKGRQSAMMGVKNGRAKLTDDIVRLIRMRLSVNEKPRSISRAMDVSVWSVYHIKEENTWRHVV